MLKRLIILTATIATALCATAQNDRLADTDRNLERAALMGWHVSLGAGFNIGGTAPLPLPREIRHIDSYDPGLQVAIEGRAEKRFHQSPWGIAIGVTLENKGMTTKARVKNYHMEAMNDDGSGEVRGAWTGHVRTKVDNSYLTIPLLATYRLDKRWSVEAGPFVSLRLHGSFTGSAYDGYIRDQDPTGEKMEVTSASYNFSSSLRRFNYGVQAGGEYRAYRHLAIRAQVAWSVNGIFPGSFGSVTFPLYPIYGRLGFAYLF
ncbi:MAG: PorT family protein [Bacteroidales bacterium]|nr:PorT family protein [Bacteroidales bacterium]MCI6103967.1 PorT family protein [Bacteroidales bacterium]MDY5087093.1 porin family protein [Alloprevotella sp.]